MTYTLHTHVGTPFTHCTLATATHTMSTIPQSLRAHLRTIEHNQAAMQQCRLLAATITDADATIPIIKYRVCAHPESADGPAIWADQSWLPLPYNIVVSYAPRSRSSKHRLYCFASSKPHFRHDEDCSAEVVQADRGWCETIRQLYLHYDSFYQQLKRLSAEAQTNSPIQLSEPRASASASDA